MPNTEYATRLESVFASAIDGILVIDERGIIEMANTAAAELFDYPRGKLLGRNVSQLMGAGIAAHHDGYIARYLRTGEARIIGIGREVEGRRRDGTMFPFRLSISELNLPDRTLFTGIVHDLSVERGFEQRLTALNAELEQRVADRTDELQHALDRLEAEMTERRRAEADAAESREDALRALERERELGELKSRFVSLASHEFRTPLSTILSSVELLKRYVTTEQQDRRERHIARITKSVVHLTDILDDFLSIGRLDEGRLSAVPVEVDVESLLHELVDYVHPTLKHGQRLELAVRLAAPTFRTDVRFLRNLVLNLLSNASKYSGPGTLIGLDVRTSPGALHLAVTDQGIGIPSDEQPQLFERFFRARNAETIQGTGLGLHIVARYLELLDGAIELRSELDVGSTFSVYIPESPEGSERSSRAGTILE